MSIDVVLCDLDGVVWLTGIPIPGSVEAIHRLRASGRRVLFVTNSSAPTIGEHTAALAAIGIDADGDVVSSAMAAGELVAAGERVLVAGGPGIVEAVERAGATAIAGDDDAGVIQGVDVVVVGLHREFDYHRLQLATAAIRAGARFVATNHDPLFPTPDGPVPGGGAIVAAVAKASGVEPVTSGKPYPPMVAAVLHLLGDDGVRRQRMVMVGDQPASDGRFSAELGCRFALVRTGYTPPGGALGPEPDYECADLAELTTLLVTG